AEVIGAVKVRFALFTIAVGVKSSGMVVMSLLVFLLLEVRCPDAFFALLRLLYGDSETMKRDFCRFFVCFSGGRG
ncbi:hypothetical protein O0S10_10480, partial [Methanocorpusculum sp. MG]